MPQTRHLLREEITYSVAKDREVNVLHQLKYPEQQSQFFGFLEDHNDWMYWATSNVACTGLFQ